MNTQMYLHPFTAKQLRVVQEELGYLVLGPQGTGTLACGDDGQLRRCLLCHLPDCSHFVRVDVEKNTTHRTLFLVVSFRSFML